MLTALLAATLLSQGLNTSGPGLAAGGKVLASYPLTTSGPLITEDANTVAHVYWNGTALVDTKGNSWTQNGTVPQVSANPFTTTRYGAGPFSNANYYSLASTNPLQFTGDFTVCVVYVKKTDTSAQALVTAGDGTTTGWRLQENLSSRPYFIADGFNGGTENVNDAFSTVTDGPNVVCGGVVSGSIKLKVNLRATVSATPTAPYTAGTSAAQIGYQATAFAGTMMEVYATSTPFTEATVVAIQQKVLGHFDGSSALAVTRATTATYAPRAADPSTLFTVPAGVARITDEGLLVEPARTNVVLASNTISAANAFNVNWVAWPDETRVDVTTTAEAAPGGGTWHTITNEAGTTSNVGQAYQTVTTASSTTFVASAWLKKPTGEDTTHAGIHVGCGAGTPSACTCVRSDGGTCTASTVATNYCQALVADLSTTPVRVSAKVRCSGAITSSIVALVPGNYGSTIGITDFTGVQHEIGVFPTSLVVTTTTAATRNADAVSATVPAVPTKWCIAVTGKPGDKINWDVGTPTAVIWSLGSGANSSQVYPYYSGGIFFRVTDAASGTRDLKTVGLISAGSHRMVACDTAGSMTFALDGTLVGSVTGAGTGVLTTPQTTLTLGGYPDALYGLSGFVKDVKICNAPKGAKDCR